ncbi:MAG: NUDIX domain-containing protein [Desulfobacteraceae bacterium]|nr:MAG: NUDIX domain-containing protein [Desulfobacteraceae bacterium]
MTTEKFAVPGAGGILEKEIGSIRHILLQERCKAEAPAETGLLEIPAGKIREFENIFDCLRREVREETGLEVLKIEGEKEAVVYENAGYQVLHYTPFSSAQNLKGVYPIMVQIFICRVAGEVARKTNETRNLRWVSIAELSRDLASFPERFYPMHVETLKKYAALYGQPGPK